MRTYKPKAGARPYKRYSNECLENAVSEIVSQKISLRKASKLYKIPVGTLSHKINKKHGKLPGRPVVFMEREEQSIIQHIKTLSQWGFPFDTLDLRILVRTYLEKQGRTVAQFASNLPSKEWARNFLQRHRNELSLRMCQNIKRSRAGVSAHEVKEYFDNLKETLADISPELIYNYDETNLSDDPGTKKCIFKRGVKYPERVKDSTKTAISVMFCGNAAGQVLPCYVVYKAENLWSTWTEGGPKGTRYNRSRSGWFDATCFTDWFETVFLPSVEKHSGKKVIIGDNLSSHFTDTVLQKASAKDVAFVCLPPNSTHLLQPLDVAFYGPMKRSWRKVIEDWKTSSRKKSVTLQKDCFPALLKKLYAHIYESDSQSSENLKSGFKKCGIVPFNPQAVLTRLPDYRCEPDSATDLSTVDAHVSESVIDMLKHLRGVDEEPVRRRRKKLSIAPGKSIASEPAEPVPGTSGTSTGTQSLGPVHTSDAEHSSSCSNSESGDTDTNSESDDTDTESRAGTELSHSDSCEMPVPTDTDLSSPKQPIVGQFYVVQFVVGKKQMSCCNYTARLITADHSKGDYEMMFMRVAEGTSGTGVKFVWPKTEDKAFVDRDQIKISVGDPDIDRRGRLLFNNERLHPFIEKMK